MMTTEEKVARMHECVKLGWSQRRIAREFAMSQPSVSELMKRYPAADDGTPVTITHGDDGKTYSRTPRRERPTPKPWSNDGKATKMVRRAHKLIAHEVPTGLDEWEKAALAEELEALGEAIQTFLTGMETM
jgi:hypothetical protein